MNKYSLKVKLTLALVILALSCVLLTGFLLQYIASQNIEAKILNKNQIISRMISDQIDIYLNDAKSTVVTAANFSSQSYGDLPQIKNEIFRIFDNFEYFDLIFYMDADARVVFSKPSNDNVSDMIHKDRSYYWEAINEGKTSISSLHVSRILNRPHFIIAAPVHDMNGRVIGLIGAGLPLAILQRL
ncbi:MAG: PDC sensor domain-containing protein [Tissierellales bacterium]